MATIATRSERPLMHIIVAMAGKAVRGLVYLIHRRRMTTRAAEFRVRTLQLEIGLSSVIENPGRPGIGIVTTTALASQRALVLIGVTMTLDAGQRSVLEGRCGMAGLTGDQRMLTDQRKSAQVMLEPDLSHPRFFRVAILATVPLLPLMDVIQPMTVVTSGHQLLFLGRDGMALLADQFCVNAA